MKQFFLKQSLTVFLLLSAFNLFSQGSYFYYGPDGKNTFELNHSQVLIKFLPELTFNEKAQVLSELQVFKPLSKEMEMPAPKVVLAEFAKNLEERDVLAVLEKLNRNNAVVYANPFFTHRDGTLEAAQDRFAVKLKSPADFSVLQSFARDFNFVVEESYAYDPLVIFVRVSKNSKGNALEVANRLSESKAFQFSEPDMLRIMKRMNTNDPDLSKQWSLNNTGSSTQYNGVNAGGTVGADMRVFSAWGITTGSAAIKVAIIDEGVDLNHPDLVANLLPGFDGTGLGSNGAPSGNDAHGTACAGITAAAGNNNIGLAGVAYSCKIVPVRIAYSNTSGNWVTSNSAIGTSLDWAWNQGGADVLSNSWGGGSSSSLINDPITRAVTQGRGGLGAPVLFAAGNSNGANSYPATLSNVVSVVAMSMCNQRKSPASCDQETFWGSNFGAGVDVAAPGVKIYTCDISGAAGYSTGNYTASFNGTSSACPNAAGVMALILSVNPGLNNNAARQILESTCDKVGGYTYSAGVSGQPNGTWSTDLGHGRVNALSAVQAANPQPCTSPPLGGTASVSPSILCSSSAVSLSLLGVNFATGQTYQWQSSPNNSVWTNISGAITISATTTASASTWYRCIVTCGGTSSVSTATQVVFNNPVISTFPHTQNFDGSSALPCGWSVANVNGDANTWAIGATNPRSAPNNVTYAYNTTLAANDWLFSAPLDLVGGTSYRVRFWQRVRSATYPENLEVKWGAAASAAGMTSAAIYSGSGLANTTYAERSGIFTPSSSGIYYLGWRAFSNADMYDLNIDDVTIEVNPVCTTPAVGGSITGPTAVNAGTNNTYTLSAWSGTSLNWQSSSDNGITWNDISGASSASASLNFNPGTILLRARVSRNGCTDAFSNQLSITVNPRIGDNLNIPIAVSLAGSGYSQSISNAVGSGFSNAYTGTNNQPSPDVFYRFTTGPCATQIRISSCGSGFDTYVHLLNASGVNLTSNDDNGVLCTGAAGSLEYTISPNTTYYAVFEGYGSTVGTINVSINEVSAVPTIQISANGPSTFCQGQSVELTATEGSSYTWSNGEVTRSIIASIAGNYTVTVVNVNGCSASASLQVTVLDNPVSGISAVGSTTFCEGGNVVLTASGGDSYAWSNGETTQSITVSTGSNYSVLVSNAAGCSASAAQVVVVNVNPTAFDVVGGGTYCNLPGESVEVGLSGSQVGVNYAFAYAGSALYTAAGTGLAINQGGFNQSGAVAVIATNASTGCVSTMIGNATVSSIEALSWFADTDGDGYGNASQSLSACVQPSGYVANANDCDDNNAALYAPILYYVDADNDGTGGTQTELICASVAPSGYASSTGDCDDNNAAVYAPILYYVDADNDGTGGTQSELICASAAPSGYASSTGDCDDNNNALVNPIAYFTDADADGFGAGNAVMICSANAPFGYASNNTDCNDAAAAVNPNASEICGNAIDDNCNGQVDEGCVLYTFYADTDADGFGNPLAAVSNYTNTTPQGYVSNNQDCNDNNAAVNPNAAEICNGIDDNCNGQIDENTPALSAALSINGPAGVCRSQSGVVFSVNAVAGASNYLWTVPAGATLVSGQGTTSIAVNFSSTQAAGSICVTASNTCVAATALCRAIIIYTAKPGTPSVINGGNFENCPGTTRTFTTPAVANATNYTWTIPANTSIVSGQGTSSLTLLFGATFTSGTLSVNAANCLGASTNRSLTLYSKPGTPSSISGPLNGVCGGSTNTFSCPLVTGASSYNWTVPAGWVVLSGQGSNSVQITAPASYSSATISVAAASICGSSTNRSITVRSVPAQPGTIAGASSNLCGGGSFNYSIAAVVGATSYQWTAPAGCTITANNGTSISLSIPGNFTSGTLSVKASNTCGLSTARTLSLTRLPSTPAAITGGTSVCFNAINRPYSVTSIAGLTYTWTVPSGASIVSGQGSNSIVVNFGASGGNVSVRASNACGNSSTRSLAVSTTACRSDDTAESTNENPTDLRVPLIYPNPGNGQLTIASFQNNEDIRLRVFSVSGQLVDESFVPAGTETWTLNLQNLPAGLYLIRLEGQHGMDELRYVKE